MRATTDRRQSIIETMCDRRFETVDNLAHQYNVTGRTIRNDIEILSCTYPIYTTRGNGGGVHVADGYYIGREYLKPSQSELLKKLALTLEGVDKKTLQDILDNFVLNKS